MARVKCSCCDNMILKTTAEVTEGLCMPCTKKSNRQFRCKFCRSTYYVKFPDGNNGLCEYCKELRHLSDDELAYAYSQLDREEEDLTPYPRNPPARSFEQLQASGIKLSAKAYGACSRSAQRYDSYDYEEEKNSPRWGDEERFYDWLCEAKIPRELAEMLYAHAPEVSFMLGPGHILGVEGIIEANALDSRTRQAHFFQLASGPNGDYIVVALEGESRGEVCYLPMAISWGETPEDAYAMAIPVCRSIGEFFAACEEENGGSMPQDYYDARKRGNK